MRPSEIARRLGKDKAWVSRQIKKLEDDLVTAYRAPEESALVRENFAQLDSLLAKSLQLVARSKDSKRQLAAIRTATDVIRQRARYEMMVGFVRRREGTTPMRLSKGDALLASLQEELPPNSVLAALEKLVELRKQPKLFKTRVGESVFK
jgi:DNA-binding MarR family transcriptional regulator